MKEIYQKYKHKIKTKEEILESVGHYRRKKKIVLANGCFDLVHVGHIRHLDYASKKAPILVVSITSDRFINKRITGPHVPQELRAFNLAALEMVDFVVIDDNEKPLDLISYLKPEYYVKGMEYHPENRGSEIGEVAALSAYGGEVLYSPGDHIYSSSALIKASPPDIKIDKLLSLMERENIGFEDLRETLDLFDGKNVSVVGDTIVDTITECAFLGAQTKTPTISGLINKVHNFVGGAGVVAKHLKSAGAEVVFSTVLGEDELSKFVCRDLQENDVKIKAITDPIRPTTNKNSISIDGNKLVKLYNMDNRSISNGVLTNICRCVSNTKSEAIIFSDFRHGIFNTRTIDKLIAAIPLGVYRVADSQVSTRWGNITDFYNFDLVCPNEREARFALADQDSGIRALASDLYDKINCRTLILKLGEKGAITCKSSNHESLDSYIAMDSFAENVVDPVGAGDAFLAYATLSMLVAGPVEATILGSIAAALECEKNGNIAVTKDDVLERLEFIERQT
jgi:rfaE bifunctional protein nucleotidyltransferase chain/domain